jgi:hypothetical protein
MRLHQRALTADMLSNGISTLEIIERYPQDKYLPSFLVRGESGGAAFHARIATDVEGDNVRIVTMCAPDPRDWDQGLRRRRNE